MYIKSLIYEDQSINWKLELMEFKPLTLLVGVSGVGKTKILKALLNLKDFSQGETIAGFKWEILFNSDKGINYKWRGEMEGQITEGMKFNFESYPEPNWHNPPIYYEQLFINDILVIDRDNDGIRFNGNQTVQLSRRNSVVYLLREESQIKDACESFNNIIFNDCVNIKNQPRFSNITTKLNEYDSIQLIRHSDKILIEKFYLCSKNAPDIFKSIKYLFIDIFPYVENLVIDIIGDKFSLLPPYISIAIKEKNVSRWIHQQQISSGMFRTLMHIAELYLCADGSVILIDEFENSLGINCINEITSSILASERNLQFIITSHHPYIINDIGFEYWKIVTRKGSLVTAIDAEKLGIGKSKHQAFTQLVNLTAYSEGITS